jgi:hypothetical protein
VESVILGHRQTDRKTDIRKVRADVVFTNTTADSTDTGFDVDIKKGQYRRPWSGA